jgi:hypothetical protein
MQSNQGAECQATQPGKNSFHIVPGTLKATDLKQAGAPSNPGYKIK